MVYCDNINRYYNFPFSNQNFEEMMVMFPNCYDRITGEDEMGAE